MKVQTIALLAAIGSTNANHIRLRPADERMAEHVIKTDIYSLNENDIHARTQQTLTVERQYEMHLAVTTSSSNEEAMQWDSLAQEMNEMHSFELNLPTLSNTLTVNLQKTNVADGHWTGTTDDNSEVYVQYHDNRLVASISQSDGSIHSLITRPDGSLWMTTILQDDRMEEEDVHLQDGSASLRDAEVEMDVGREQSLDGTVVGTPRDGPGLVDVLVVYTKAAMCAAAGQGQTGACAVNVANKQPIEDLITLAVNNNNIAHNNAQTGTQINLRDMYLDEAYTEPGNQSTSLNDLRINGDGKLDSAHIRRDAVGADMVALILNSGSGVAYVNASASSAFSTTRYSYISGHTFAHELGHNWGCYHDRANSGPQTDYAHGYPDPNGAFRSILSYPCPGVCTRVNWYSNDVAQYNGQPIGNASNNCARKINERRNTVANFRQAVGSPVTTPAPVTSTSAPVTTPVGTPSPVSQSAVQEALDFVNEAIVELEKLV